MLARNFRKNSTLHYTMYSVFCKLQNHCAEFSQKFVLCAEFSQKLSEKSTIRKELARNFRKNSTLHYTMYSVFCKLQNHCAEFSQKYLSCTIASYSERFLCAEFSQKYPFCARNFRKNTLFVRGIFAKITAALIGMRGCAIKYT